MKLKLEFTEFFLDGFFFVVVFPYRMWNRRQNGIGTEMFICRIRMCNLFLNYYWNTTFKCAKLNFRLVLLYGGDRARMFLIELNLKWIYLKKKSFEIWNILASEHLEIIYIKTPVWLYNLVNLFVVDRVLYSRAQPWHRNRDFFNNFFYYDSSLDLSVIWEAHFAAQNWHSL